MFWPAWFAFPIGAGVGPEVGLFLLILMVLLRPWLAREIFADQFDLHDAARQVQARQPPLN